MEELARQAGARAPIPVSPPQPSSPDAESVRRLQALARASVAVNTERSLDGVLRTIVEAARDVLQARYAALGVIDEAGTGLSRFVTAGIDDATARAIGALPSGRGLLGHVITERRPVRVRVLADHPRSAGLPPNHPPMSSFLGVPITVRDTAYGSLYVTEKQGAAEFSDADESLALLLASQAGVALDNALAFQTLRQTQRELEAKQQQAADSILQMQSLVQASLALSTELSLDAVLQKIADVARDVLRARYAALGVINDTGTGLSRFITAGIDADAKARIGPLPTGKGLLGQLIAERRPLRLRVLSAHPQSAGFPANHPPMSSFLGVPITVRDRAYGNLYVTEKQGAPEFSESDEVLARMLASQAAVVIENASTFRALHEAQEKLVRRERLATMGQLAGGVGHELRNPLGVIKNAVYFLGMVLPEDQKVRKHLGILNREVDTCNRIITTLLDFSRSKPATRAPTDVTAVAREAVDRLSVPDNVAMRLELDRSLAPVPIDPTQVGQVVLNFLSNAVQAMTAGGTLTVATGRTAEGTFISVADTGVGITAENLSRIFQPLFTTKAKGIGLGLALSRDLAEVNGGRIDVSSAPGEGSRFTLLFPEAPQA